MSACWIAVAFVATFLVHESLLVLLGRRGPRARREQGPSARTWLVVFGTTAVLAGVLALALAPAARRWALALPLAPAAVVAVSLVRDRERTILGEVCTALTFSSGAGAISLVSGSTMATAMTITVAFSVVFTAATLAVHVVVAQHQRVMRARPRALRVGLVTLAGVTLASMGVAAVRGLTDTVGIMAVVPGVGVALWLAANPPSPQHLRRVGWAIAATAALTTVVLIVGL